MMRLSRSFRLPRWTIAIAVLFVTIEMAISIYFAVLNHRLSRELLSHRWREPTVFLSAARNSEVAKVYGVDWRPTPPISLDALPAYVPNAFIAAEDVRFRNHFGVDPVGMARAL